MGNETSSMKIHSLLTAEDLKGLRSEFPGGATSATPVTDLKWGAWKRAWPDNRRETLEKKITPQRFKGLLLGVNPFLSFFAILATFWLFLAKKTPKPLKDCLCAKNESKHTLAKNGCL